MQQLLHGITSRVGELTDFFTTHPVGRAYVAERAEATQAERRRLADRLAEVLGVKHEQTKKLDAALPALLQKEAIARRALLAAEQALTQFHFKRNAVRNNGEERQLEIELRKLADPRIAEAVAKLKARAANLMNAEAAKHDLRPDPSGLRDDQMRPVMVIFTNEPARRRILAAVAAARDRFEQLIFEVPDDLEGMIASIEASVPWDALGELTPVGVGPLAAA